MSRDTARRGGRRTGDEVDAHHERVKSDLTGDTHVLKLALFGVQAQRGLPRTIESSRTASRKVRIGGLLEVRHDRRRQFVRLEHWIGFVVAYRGQRPASGSALCGDVHERRVGRDEHGPLCLDAEAAFGEGEELAVGWDLGKLASERRAERRFELATFGIDPGRKLVLRGDGSAGSPRRLGYGGWGCRTR